MYIKVIFKNRASYVEIHFSEITPAHETFNRMQALMGKDIVWSNSYNSVDMSTVASIHLYEKKTIPL